MAFGPAFVSVVWTPLFAAGVSLLPRHRTTDQYNNTLVLTWDGSDKDHSVDVFNCRTVQTNRAGAR